VDWLLLDLETGVEGAIPGIWVWVWDFKVLDLWFAFIVHIFDRKIMKRKWPLVRTSDCKFEGVWEFVLQNLGMKSF
jgi:hypothetical protein